MSKEYPLSVQIGEIEREIRMRERVYPGMIAQGKLKASDAAHRIAILYEVVKSLRDLRTASL